jgi:hypothetical protein
VFLDQMMRRQEEYIKSLGPVKKPVKENKTVRVHKAQSTLATVSIREKSNIESASVIEVAKTVQELLLIDTRLISAYIESTDAELKKIERDSGTFELDEASSANTTIDLSLIFDKYVPKTKGEKMTYKMVGLPVPLDIHARMLNFMEVNKDKTGAPKTLKDLGLMCLGYALDSLESSQPDAV